MSLDEQMQKFLDFSPYVNANGMMPFCGTPPCISDNDTLFTAYAYMAIVDLFGGNDKVPLEFKAKLIEAYDKHLNEDGSTKRTPNATGLDSNDNLTGWAIMSFYLDQDWAARILRFARTHGWLWPSSEGEPVEQRWLGRHRAVEAHLMLGTQNEVPDYLLQFFWAIAVVMGAFGKKTDADAFSLGYCLVRLAIECPRTPRPMLAVAAFWKFIQRLRGRTMSQNLAEVYGWAGSPHSRYIK